MPITLHGCHSIAVIPFLILIFHFAQPVSAQTVSRPERGSSRATTYDVGDVDRVDLRNGNLSISIPLASLPPISGGKLGYTIYAHYNSKLWDSYLREQFVPGAPDYEISGPPMFYTADVPKPSSAGGWRIGARYQIVSESASDDFVRSTARTSANDIDYAEINNNPWHKTFLTTPDGSRHELRPFGFPTFEGSADFYRGYYKVSPAKVGRPIDYYSFDGTFLRVRIFTADSELEWRILQSDGIMIENFRDGRQRISDTNGNAILIIDEGSERIFREERTGRQLILRRLSESVSEVVYRTVGGGSATIRINHRKTKVFKTFQIPIPPSEFDSNGGCVIDETVGAEFTDVERIEFPATERGKAGRVYAFAYNDSETENAMAVLGCNMVPLPVAGLSSGGGEISAMTIPTGATYRYRYHLDDVTRTGENLNTVLAANTVSARTVEHDGLRTEWLYSFGSEQSQIRNPDGTVTLIERYPSWLTSGSQGEEGLSGLVYRETLGDKLKIERRWKRLVFAGANDRSAEKPVVFNAVISEEYKTVYSADGKPSKTSATIFEHDFNGNVLSATTYDWLDSKLFERDERGIPKRVPDDAPILTRTETAFHHSPQFPESDAIYHANTSRILSTRLRVVTGESVEEFAYDGEEYGILPDKGNLTASRRWLDSDAVWLEERSEYDHLGNITRKIDADGHAVLFGFEDEIKANPTSVTRRASQASAALSERYSFDFHTGLLISATDINGHRTDIDYENLLLGDVDPYGRPGKESKPAGMSPDGSSRQESHYLYEDSFNRTTLEIDVLMTGDRGSRTRHTKDQLGRTVKIERNESGAEEFSISARIIYSSDGQSILTENPTRANSKSATDGWTRITRDALGRTVRVSTFTGSKTPSFSKDGSNWNGDILHKHDADKVTITDQAGKWTRRHTDPLGRLVRLEEPSDDTGSASHSSSTFYRYDLNGNLTRIEQGTEIRTFRYDSLSRLIVETSPESGQTSYLYDSRGNRKERNDANGVRTRYLHDGLGRLTKVLYSHSEAGSFSKTPDVFYSYDDPAVPNSLGRLTSVISDSGSRYIDGYDESGRLHGERIVIGTTHYPLRYEYSVAGHLVSTKRSSGTRIIDDIDTSGQIRAIKVGSRGEFGEVSVASGIKYHPSAALAEFHHGNGLREMQTINSRFQPVRLTVDAGPSTAGIFTLENHYRPISRSGLQANNGNIHRQTVSQGVEQTDFYFKYDRLNRISEFQARQKNKPSFEEPYKYDRNGNLISEEFLRPIATEKRDAVGNLSLTRDGNRHWFDAENRLVMVKSREGMTLSSYEYDGEGRRISKTLYLNNLPVEKTFFIHDAAGRLISEYSTVANTRKESRRFHLTSDHLDSIRMVTDESGKIVSRHDYGPFGQEFSKTHFNEKTRRFAGHDTDSETGFVHAQARTFSPAHRRFLSADPITVAPDRLADPQRLNRFSYVRNNPLRYSDPSGEDLHIKITNIVVGYQYLVDVNSGRKIRTEVLSYRVIVTNDSGTRRIFELTRGSSHGKRGQYGRFQEAPPGEYVGKVRRDGRRGFRVELTEPGQPDGQMTTPDAPRNRGNIQLHRNGLYVQGCMTFPISDYDRFEQTITAMLEQDRIGGFDTKIFVSLIPRNQREGSSDFLFGDPRISLPDLLGDQDGTRSNTKEIFQRVIPASPMKLQ